MIPLHMRLICLAALAALLPAAAQTVPERGADGTFDVATWNVEFFGDPTLGPSDDATQLANVAAVIEQAGIDLWTLQEVVDQTEWAQLLDRVQDDGYAGILGPQVSNTPRFDQRLAFIYKTDVVSIVGQRTILSGTNFGGRDPFEVQARVTIEGQARTIRVIGFHAKASTDDDSYRERVRGAAELKTYIDDRIARGESVILLGDYNDLLLRSTLSGQPSPYRDFVDNADYVTATLPLEQATIRTFCRNSACTSGDTRDHILFTANLSAEYVAGSADRIGEVLSGVPNYVNSTSDHIPVIASFSFRPVAAEDAPEAGPVALLAPTPNPFRGATQLRFRLDAPSDVQLDVFDVVGRRVASLAGAFGAGEHPVSIDGAALAPGTYVVRLMAGGLVRTRLVVRAE